MNTGTTVSLPLNLPNDSTANRPVIHRHPPSAPSRGFREAGAANGASPGFIQKRYHYDLSPESDTKQVPAMLDRVVLR
jgi:hypothetical protein